MDLLERAHVLHRVWRYRLRSERQEIAYLMSRSLRGATVIDVGANRGIYSYWMHRSIGPGGRVIAFEPQPELFSYLQQLRTAFKLDRLVIENCGLSKSTGQADLVRPRDHWGGASMERRAGTDSDTLSIALTTLDKYMGEHEAWKPVRFIKCDIEGHELECFQGAHRILSMDGPELLFESHGRRIEAIASYLNELDYTGHFFFRNQLLPLSAIPQVKDELTEPYLNYIFTRI